MFLDPPIVVPLTLKLGGGLRSLISTTAFGTPVDITLSELAMKTFFPAYTATAEMLQRLAALRIETAEKGRNLYRACRLMG